MIIRKKVFLGLIFFSMLSVIPLRAEDIQSPIEESATITAPSSSEPGMKMEEGGMKHEDMHKDKEHEGMHGMMMGHNMGGWGIVIVALMIAMMTGHILVIAR